MFAIQHQPDFNASHLISLALPVGAGNFRRMAGPPVYGVAMCTVQGIRNVLGAVADAQPAGKKKVRQKALAELICSGVGNSAGRVCSSGV